MDLPRLKISERMRALMSYPRFAAAKPRMLVLQSEYWLDKASFRAAQRLGWEVMATPVRMVGLMPRELVEQLIYALAEFRPDFVLSVNMSAMDEQGMLARFFEDLGVPLATWFADDPRTILMDRDWYGGAQSIAFSWERAYCAYLREHGFAEALPLPLAADISLFNAEPADAWDLPPTFVGNSMIEFSERESVWFRERPALAALLDEAFAGGRVTRENFGAGLSAVIGEDAAAGLDAEARRHIELLLFVEGTRRLRHALAEGLAPEGLVPRGDDFWRRHFPHAGPPVNYEHELPAHYRACPVNLNTTSIQMANTVNQRVFDCPAAGGFLLTDAQSDLELLFDTSCEVAAYHAIEEARELLRFYMNRPAARRTMTMLARKRILGEHTYANRIEAIAETMRSRFKN